MQFWQMNLWRCHKKHQIIAWLSDKMRQLFHHLRARTTLKDTWEVCQSISV